MATGVLLSVRVTRIQQKGRSRPRLMVIPQVSALSLKEILSLILIESNLAALVG